MTQEQYKWLQDNGYDPTVHDVDDQGNIFENPINQPQQKEVMSPLRAGLTSFAGNLLPSAAGLYAGAQTGALGGSMFGPVGTVLGGIGGGLAGGYGAGKLQEKALEEFAPGAAEEMARAQRDQPVASYLGGFAPNALALKPSFGGIKGLAAPLMSMEKEAARAAFTPAALNVGANVAGSTAGQLLDVAQGGEFSVPRFAADVALGSVFSDPNKLGRKFGLQALKPEVAAPEQAMDLGALRTADTEAREAARVAGETESARIIDETRGQMAAGGMTGREVEMFKTRPEMEWWKQPEATRIEDIRSIAKQAKQRMPKGMAEQLAGLPEVYDVIQNPEKFPSFLASSLEEALNASHERGMQDRFLSVKDLERQEQQRVESSNLVDYKNSPERAAQLERARQEREAALTPGKWVEVVNNIPGEPDRKVLKVEFIGDKRVVTYDKVPKVSATEPEVARPTRAAVTTEEILGRQSQAAKPVDEGISLEQALKPTPEEVAKAEKIQADIARVFDKRDAAELRKLQDLDAAQALNDEAAARLQSLQARQDELLNLAQREPSYVRKDIRGNTARDIAQAKQELADARAIADDLYTRLQSAGGEGLMSQADLDAATKLAAQRGLRVLPATPEQQAQGIRGAYVVNENGERVIYINPFAATADTAIHEIGHDVFKTSANERMRRSLMDTAMDSEAYKRELEYRLKEGKTQDQAQDLALEEGLVQAFGEQHPNVKPGEIRQWFNALKSSVKSMVGMKISPEDALAWMHYATTEAVPWKGVAVAKVGEERFSRAKEASRRLLEDDIDWQNMGSRQMQRDVNLEDLISGVMPELKMYQEKPNVFREDVVISRAPSLLSNEGSWGRAYTTGARNEGHVMIDSALWDAAVSNESGMRERFVKVLKHELGHIDDAPNIGEYGAARDERVANEFAARYQRGLLEKIQTPSEMDALIKQGGPFERVGSTIRDASNTRDYKQGEWSSKYSLATKLRPDDQVRLFNHLAQEFDSGVRSAPATELRAAYDQLRNEYLPAIVNDYNAQGFTVRDTAGQRARGTNPTYIPLHAIADEVKTILTTLQGSPEYKKLENDFKQWNTQLRQADGATLQEAQNYANEKFEEKIQITAKTPGIESGIPFSGARKPEGYPLPPSWRSTDLISNLDNYTKRSATDFAYQKHVESSPEAMAALGAKTMVNNQPIPANILAATPNVINNDSVQSVLREYRGTPAQKNEGVLSGIGRSVSAATIGPVSKVGDIGTSLIKGLVYMPAGEYTSGLIDFTNRLGDWAALKERSYASGLNKRDAAQNMRQVLGIAEDSVNFMDKVARVISKGTGLNQLESVARTVAQAWGETVVKYNKTLALGGDKNALQMLDTLSPDWRTRSDADLSAQVGRLLQGSYDMRQLPASVLEGAAAPYLTWSKWSIGQYDSFVKYAMKPAMQGNVKPLIGQMLIGVLGGGAVSAVQEWLNNRQGKDISWKELESWMQQNQGQLGADGGQLLAQKLLTMAQKLGTFGFAGDIAKMTVDAASGGSAQGIATMPALDAIYDVSKRAAAAAKALDDGEDFGLVLQALLKDSVIGHMQVARVARNWLDEDENLRYDDRRSRRLYDELSGLPSKGGAFAVNYSNLSEREFERGDITEKTGEEAFNLVSRARQEATSGEDYASRIRKLKTSQNQIMPSLERQPQKAARYLSFVEGAEPGKGSETLKRYYTRQNEDKYRKSLIEGMSGIR
jgi:hypothetical protein